MLDRTRHLRLALVLIVGVSAGLFPILGPFARSFGPSVAFAADDDDDEGDDDDGDDEGDDTSGAEEGDDEEEDEDQPPITAGGLYVLKTYPISEIQRPLTMTEGISEGKLGIGFDISNKTAFKNFGASLDYRYGLKDNFELQAGFKGIYNFKGLNFYAGFEAGIVYDFLDFRATLVVNRPGGLGGDDGETPVSQGVTGFAVDVGFPFRYAPKEQVAVVAFDTLFQFDIVADDFSLQDGELKKDARPDAKPSIGIIVQPIPAFAIKLTASAQIPNFDFSTTDSVVIPATMSFQYTPKFNFDFGMEFTFNDLKPPEPIKFYDSRFLLFYAQYRVGR